MAIAIDPATEIPTTVEELPLTSLAAAPDNPRKHLDGVDELAASMSELGLLNPLVVTPRAGKFMVVCGHRRHAAAKQAGLETVPVIVRELDEPQRIKAMLIENCQRSDLTPLEEARGYKQLVDLGLTQKAIAGDVGKTQGHISKRLALLEIPKPAMKALDSGGISIEDALELTRLRDDPERQNRAWKQRGQVYGGLARAIKDELDAKQADELIAAEEAKLTKKGIRTIRFNTGGYYPTLPRNTGGYYPTLPRNVTPIRRGGSYEALNLDPAKHASEPCHAVAVRIDYGKVQLVHVCTDRSRHPKLKTGDENWRAPSTESQAQKQARELRKLTPARRGFAGVLVKGRTLTKDERIELRLDTLLRSAHGEVLKIACRMLDLEAGNQLEHREALRDYATTQPKRDQVELAIAFGTHEEFLTGPWGGWENHADYFDLLERHGYELTPIEAKKAGRKRKAAA